MVHRDGCAPDRVRWQKFLADVDQRLTRTIVKYRHAVGGLTGRDFADAYRALAFGGADGPGDPDYSLQAMPVAYALRLLRNA